MSSWWLILNPVALQKLGEGERDRELFPATGMKGHFHPQLTKAHTTWIVGEKSLSNIWISLRRLISHQTFPSSTLKG